MTPDLLPPVRLFLPSQALADALDGCLCAGEDGTPPPFEGALVAHLPDTDGVLFTLLLETDDGTVPVPIGNASVA